MKRLFLPLLLLTITFGCARPELISPEEEEALARARTRGATILTAQKPTPIGDVVVTLLEANDSRCPKNVTCFWYGYAAATLQVKDFKGASVNQLLYLGGPLPAPNDRGFRHADTVDVQLGTKEYRLILSDIQPYPNLSDNNPSERKVMLSVKPL